MVDKSVEVEVGSVSAVKKETALERIKREIARMTAANKDSPTTPRVRSGKRIESIESLPEAVSPRCRTRIVEGLDPEKPELETRKVIWSVCCDLLRAAVDDETIYGILTDERFKISASVLARGLEAENFALRLIQRTKEYAIDPRLLELNERHAVIESYGGRCRVLESPDQDGERKNITLQTFDDFKNRYMNRKVSAGFDRKTGRPIETPLGAWWLDHAARRQFHSITFEPGIESAPGVYNLWRGFAIKAEQGNKHQRYLDHVKENICNNDEAAFAYLLCWMARAIQKPNAPGGVAIVLRGGKGTGKTVFADVFGKLFGRHYWAVTDAKFIVGNFNAHLRDCVLLFGDEAFWAGDRKHESVLKGLITGRKLVIESKGVDAETANNNVHLIMASNSDWVVPTSYDERRFLVLDVAKTRQGDKTYFDAVMKEMEEGGYATLLHELQAMDLTNFNHYAVPNTEALQDQKLHSMEPYEEWWFGKLRDGHLQSAHPGWTTPIAKDSLIEDYLAYAQRISAGRRVTSTKLARFIQKCCSGLVQFSAPYRGRDALGNPQVGSTAWWQFPSLDSCRAEFATHVGGMTIVWPEIEMRAEPASGDRTQQPTRFLS